jgi:hypothetical protein
MMILELGSAEVHNIASSNFQSQGKSSEKSLFDIFLIEQFGSNFSTEAIALELTSN